MAQHTLEQALAALCEKYDLYAISVSLNTDTSERGRCSAYVHWQGLSHGGNSCAQGIAATIPEALNKALLAAATDRAPIETLPSIPVEA